VDSNKTEILWLTSNLPASINEIVSDKPGVAVAPPDFQPINLARKRFYTGMEPETEATPFVVLVLRPHIIYSCSPKASSLETTAPTLFNSFRLYCFEKLSNKFSDL
jgi:hypothetical protein